MPLLVNTGPIENLGCIHGYEEIIDITNKSKTKKWRNMFAPGWDLTMDYKKGRITKTDYQRHYMIKLRGSRKLYEKDWKKLTRYIDSKHMKRIRLICFCKTGQFCHRLILAKALIKLGALKGEIQ